MPNEPRRWRCAARVALAMLLLAGFAAWASHRRLRGEPSLADGRSTYDQGAWEEAARRAREVLKAEPTSIEAVRLLARSSARLGRDDSALMMFQRLGPDGLEAEDCFLLACILSRHEQPASARAQLWKAHGKDPAHGETLNDLIRGLAREDSVAEAINLAVKLRAIPGWRARGEVAMGLLEAARDCAGGGG